MATIVIGVGNTSLEGRQYSTWQAAADSIPKDVVSSGNKYILRGYNDGEFSVAGVALLLAGFTTSATNNIRIECATGHSYRDHSTILTGRLDYNATRGVAIRSTSGNEVIRITGAPYTEIDGIQVYGAVVGIRGVIMESANCTLVNSIVNAYPNANGAVVAAHLSANAVVANNVIVSRRTATYGITIAGGTANQNTVAVVSDQSAGTYGLQRISTTAATVGKNNSFFNFTTTVSSSGAGSLDFSNNATTASSIGVTSPNSLVNLVFADQLTGTTAAAFDARLKAGNVLADAGVATAYTSSANNISRPSGSAFDIGAWETPTPADTLMISGNATGTVNAAITYNITANGSVSGTVTVTPADDDAGGGTFSPASITVPGSFTYTPGSAGTKVITLTNDGGLVNPAPFSLTVNAELPTGTFVSQTVDGSKVTILLNTTASPTSGAFTMTAAGNGAQTKTGTITFGSGTATLVCEDLVPGDYTPSCVLTNAGGSNAATGFQSVQIIGVTGEPEIPSGAATAVTLSGATTGTINVATTFTVNTNGERAGAVVVTPTPVAGVTFNPTSVTLAAGTAGATFTATSTTTGAKVIAVTNDGSLTDPSAITWTVSEAADATAPVLTGSVSISSIGQTSATASWSVGTDNVGVVGYDRRINGGAIVDVGNVTSSSLTGLVASTAYTVEVRARDAAGLVSGWISGSFNTTAAAVTIKAQILVNGVMVEIPQGQVGSGKKPIVYVDGRLRQRVASEGTPVVKVGSRYRLLRAGETLEV